MKDRLQREQSFQRGVGARAFVYFEDNFLALWLRAIRSRDAHWHGGSLVSELTCLNRCQRFLVAAQREFIGCLARDSQTLGHALGGEAHGEVGVGIVIHQPRVR